MNEEDKRLFLLKKILGINWQRYSEIAMRPGQSQDSIIVSLLSLIVIDILAQTQRTREGSTEKIH